MPPAPPISNSGQTPPPVPGQGPIARLRSRGVDASQIGDRPLPADLWGVIEKIVRHIRGKRARWFAAASLYGRFLTALASGREPDELAAQFADGKKLARLLTNPEMRE